MKYTFCGVELEQVDYLSGNFEMGSTRIANLEQSMEDTKIEYF